MQLPELFLYSQNWDILDIFIFLNMEAASHKQGCLLIKFIDAINKMKMFYDLPVNTSVALASFLLYSRIHSVIILLHPTDVKKWRKKYLKSSVHFQNFLKRGTIKKYILILFRSKPERPLLLSFDRNVQGNHACIGALLMAAVHRKLQSSPPPWMSSRSYCSSGRLAEGISLRLPCSLARENKEPRRGKMEEQNVIPFLIPHILITFFFSCFPLVC